MDIVNEMRLVMDSRSINEGFSRIAVASFIASADPNIEELTDIKTAVSEAVTNAIVHGYREKNGKIYITVSIFENNTIRIKIRDKGVGIADIEKAMQAGYSTASDNIRSLGFGAGMGLPNMKKYTDSMIIDSTVGVGTRIVMRVNC